MTKILKGSELAGFVKERQRHVANMLRGAGVKPRLVIVRDSENPVITKYVNLKRKYGEDIGVIVDDAFVDEADESKRLEELKKSVREASTDPNVHGIIVQLPLTNTEQTDEVVAEIAPEKDVDGLGNKYDGSERDELRFDSATATAINWLLTGYGIELEGKKIAIVGRGRLVGRPLIEMWTKSGYDVEVFHRGSDFARLVDKDVIVTATGAPHLIASEMIRPGAVVIDAGTASEGGHLVGDISDKIRAREDLGAVTPKFGGVGPLTVGVLFEDVLAAASRSKK